jgi:hypothetical protein
MILYPLREELCLTFREIFFTVINALHTAVYGFHCLKADWVAVGTRFAHRRQLFLICAKSVYTPLKEAGYEWNPV